MTPARRRQPVDIARRAAYDALVRSVRDDAYLNLVLPPLLAERGLTDRDAGFATELAYGTARLSSTYDAVLEHCVRGGVGSLQQEVAVALRMGCHQLLSMRVAEHAAVTTTVDLVRAVAGERPVRLANAVLRKVTGQNIDQWIVQVAPDRRTDPHGHLAVRYAHPRWVVDAFADVLHDEAEVVRLLAADNAAAAVTLAVRPGLASADDLAGVPGESGRWSPFAWRLASGDPSRVDLVREGRAGVQDEGSQLVALLFAEAAGSSGPGRWLDLCSGPGGKAALLTGLAHTQGSGLVAVERQPHRAALVARALRAYSGPPPVLIADATVPVWRTGAFDAVIADVPCTGLGALRRRPDARRHRDETDLDALVPLQNRLLAAALDATRPGGIVAYVTCSPHRRETRDVVDAVRNDGAYRVEELDAREFLVAALRRHGSSADDLDVALFGDGPHVQLWPHRHGTDAMFASLLRREV